MLRYAVQRITGKNFPLVQEHAVEIHTAEHTAKSRLHIRDGRIALTQQRSPEVEDVVTVVYRREESHVR